MFSLKENQCSIDPNLFSDVADAYCKHQVASPRYDLLANLPLLVFQQNPFATVSDIVV